MNVYHDITHEKFVQAWEKKAAFGLSEGARRQLFAEGILAVRRRSLATLSEVSVMVVSDRALRQVSARYPVLATVLVQREHIDFSKLLACERAGAEDRDINSALRAFLIEFLNILANITADILTAPLHQALAMVTGPPARVELYLG